jgi:glucose-1-phosphatase
MQNAISNIKNIIFDLGGVIINIDYRLTANAFKNLGIPQFDTLFSQLKQTPLFDLFETGKISSQEFRSELKKAIPFSITDSQINIAWNAMLLDFPPQKIELLQKIKNKYRTFLLSNTNEIHTEKFNIILQNQTGYNSLEPLFEKVYLSHKIGLRKPDKAIFDLVLNENKLKPAETLFIDDSPQHIEAAQQCGIQTIHLTQPEMLYGFFSM